MYAGYIVYVMVVRDMFGVVDLMYFNNIEFVDLLMIVYG